MNDQISLGELCWRLSAVLTSWLAVADAANLPARSRDAQRGARAQRAINSARTWALRNGRPFPNPMSTIRRSGRPAKETA